MGMLITALIAIGLFSYVLMVGINYLNTNTILSTGVAANVVTQFSLAGSAVNRYRLLYGAYPSTISDISPRFFAGVSPIDGLAWSIDTQGRWVCLSGTASPVNVDAIARAAKTLKPPVFIVSKSCGSELAEALSSESPIEISATLWISK